MCTHKLLCSHVFNNLDLGELKPVAGIRTNTECEYKSLRKVSKLDTSKHSDTMKFFVALISFLLCCSHIMAECPSVCPALYSPVCGQAQINGKTVQCQFSNSCAMGVSACKRQISKSTPSSRLKSFLQSCNSNLNYSFYN